MYIFRVFIFLISFLLLASCGSGVVNTCDGIDFDNLPSNLVQIDGNYSLSEHGIASIDEKLGIGYGDLDTEALYNEYAIAIYMRNYSIDLSKLNLQLQRSILDFFVKPAYSCSIAQHYITNVQVENLTIVSKQNYDQEHPAGASLNDYFNIQHLLEGRKLENISISQFNLNNENAPVEFTLYITSQPESDSFYEFTASFILTNGLKYDIDFSHYLKTVAN